MELLILGSGTATPNPRRGSPGCLVSAGGDRLLLDAGPGTMERLLRAGVGLHEVTHIFCTHDHLDHCAEIAAWLFASRVPTAARTAPLTLGGSEAFLRMFEKLQALYGDWLAAPTYPLTLTTLAPDAPPVTGKGWALASGPVAHIESSLAFRITADDGRVLVYTGDTAPCDEVSALSRGADLILIEASSPDGERLPRHLTPSDAGEIARRAEARAVMLTHLNPRCDEVDLLGQLARTYDGPARVAEDGLRVTV